MAEEVIQGVVVVKTTAEDKREFKRKQQDRIREFADMLETTPVDWDGSIGKVDSEDAAVEGHRLDRERKLREADWS